MSLETKKAQHASKFTKLCFEMAAIQLIPELKITSSSKYLGKRPRKARKWKLESSLNFARYVKRVYFPSKKHAMRFCSKQVTFGKDSWLDRSFVTMCIFSSTMWHFYPVARCCNSTITHQVALLDVPNSNLLKSRQRDPTFGERNNQRYELKAYQNCYVLWMAFNHVQCHPVSPKIMLHFFLPEIKPLKWAK